MGRHVPSSLRPGSWFSGGCRFGPARLAALLIPLQIGLTTVAAPALAAPVAIAEDDPVQACRLLRRQGDGPGLGAQQQGLIDALEPAPSLEDVLLSAEQLIACAAPQAALTVLARVSPAAGESRRRWLVMQWRAAQAGLHHNLAAQALTLLAQGEPQRLEELFLPLGLPAQNDRPDTRSALDLLADHLESLGQRHQAAKVLLASSSPGAASAARWGRAVALADTMPLREQDEILELALEQAAAAGAWGLVAALLDQQLAAGVSDPASRQALDRRLRLGERIDDAYGEWLQRRQLSGPDHDSRNEELERLLRSPRQPGGHLPPAPPTPSPSLGPSPAPAPDSSLTPQP
ncbi:hypothetical protein KBY96_10490 [Cyanobium sp. ATX 6A2]|uniref:hypothetical protein n=1 Tax=Cyanobium sp. ATX 6A2 TaxID=2823700 RepID=UPI0020CD6896|nr:hypothetical protein [Cyanobium sp. ATX 6A2]MCP9888352.1 hypothetical protein [Cyanobium sp. ATX 6A2]